MKGEKDKGTQDSCHNNYPLSLGWIRRQKENDTKVMNESEKIIRINRVEIKVKLNKS